MYPVTHLPGNKAFRTKIKTEIPIGAKNPNVLSISDSLDLKVK
jgi:hypothetical protein